MTLAQLRNYLAIAETGSVHAAARQLFVTDSAVSASLASLQRALGIRLVQRDGRRLRLTDAGLVYANYVQRILGLLEEAEATAFAEADPEHGSLRIAALTTPGEQILPRLLTSFRQHHRDVRIRLEVGNRQRVQALQDCHEVDLLLGGRPAPGRPVQILGVRPHEMIAVAPPGCIAKTSGKGILEWVSQQTWLIREEGSGTRQVTESFLAGLALGQSPAIVTVCSNAAIRESVVSGLGVTMISREAVARELSQGILIELPLPGTPVQKDWYLMADPGELPPIAEAFVGHVLMTDQFQPFRRGDTPTVKRSTVLPPGTPTVKAHARQV